MASQRRSGKTKVDALRKTAQNPAALREALGISAPPVIASQVAQALGLIVEALPVTETGFLHALTYTLDGVPRIVVDARKPPAVVNFGIAHEIYEAILPDDRRGKERHAQANQFAADLLLPPEWVREAVDRLGYDVVKLADAFQVSCEAMALRLVQFYELGLTIVDNGQVVRRTASDGLSVPASLLPEEKQALRRLAEGEDRTVETGNGYKILGFRVPGESPVLRLILFIVPTTEP